MKDLLHRNIVALMDHGAAGSAFYFIMELCEGGSVGDWVKQDGGKLKREVLRACRVGLRLAEGRNGFRRAGAVRLRSD